MDGVFPHIPPSPPTHHHHRSNPAVQQLPSQHHVKVKPPHPGYGHHGMVTTPIPQGVMTPPNGQPKMPLSTGSRGQPVPVLRV